MNEIDAIDSDSHDGVIYFHTCREMPDYIKLMVDPMDGVSFNIQVIEGGRIILKECGFCPWCGVTAGDVCEVVNIAIAESVYEENEYEVDC